MHLQHCPLLAVWCREAYVCLCNPDRGGAMLQCPPRHSVATFDGRHTHRYAPRARCRAPKPPAAAAPAAPPPLPAAEASSPEGSIPGATTCCVTMADVVPGLRGLQATQAVRQGAILLSIPFSHMLAVPTEQTAVPSWLSTYIEPLEQQWQLQLPEDLMDLLSAVADQEEDTSSSSKPNEHVRMAALLLWVRRHASAPFWQQYIQQLPRLEQYTAAGTAWSPDTINQLQWPYLQELLMEVGASRTTDVQRLVQLLTTAPLNKLQLLEGDPAAAAEAAAWAVQAAYTRCHATPGHLLLVPYEDMANHSSMPTAGFFTATNCHGLIAAEDIQAGQEVVEGYQADADTAELLANWGFLEQGNPSDWLYPIQRPLQLLPRLPWDVVLAAAGRLFDCMGASPEELVEQQQQLPWTAEALAALQDGRGAVRVLTAAASLPVATDGTLASLDPDAAEEAVQLDAFLQKELGAAASYQQQPLPLQRSLWSQPARAHIMQQVVEGVGGQAAAAAVVMADTPQQRWEATLGALTATLLGLHARVGLLAMPTSTGEDLALLAEPGGHAAAAAAGSSQTQQGKAKVLQLLQQELQGCTRALVTVAAEKADSSGSSSSSSSGRGEMLMGLAQRVERLMDMTDRAQQVESERERQQEQQLCTSTSSSTPPATGGRDAVSVLAVEARLEQKLLLQVYSLLCDAIMVELNTVLAEEGEQRG